MPAHLRSKLSASKPKASQSWSPAYCAKLESVIRQAIFTPPRLAFPAKPANVGKSMTNCRVGLAGFFLSTLTVGAQTNAVVHVLGEMRRMFMEHDIGAHVELAAITKIAHVYALGPVAGLQGEVTVLDGQVFVSTTAGGKPTVALDPKIMSVFLVYASVPAWESSELPANVRDEHGLAAFLENRMPKNTRCAFLVRATALAARYHIQNYRGRAEDLTHDAHESAKVFYEVTEIPVELLGFFTNCEADGGSFVHLGQTTHIHLISADRKNMGHLESITLDFGARLFLPQSP
jgi:acetolactate decarboxylase